VLIVKTVVLPDESSSGKMGTLQIDKTRYQETKQRLNHSVLLWWTQNDFGLASAFGGQYQSITCLRSVTYIFQLQIHWAERHLCLVHYVLFCSVWLEVCLNLTVGLLQTEHLTNGKYISIL